MRDDEFFFRLSPEVVLKAVESGGRRPSGHCFALNALENRVYDVRLDDGDHLVAKFYRPGRWSREAILEEHAMLATLREREIPVCAPLAFPDGETLHEIENIYFALWPRTGGRAPDELRDDQVRVLGHLLARIHNAGESLHPTHRPRLASDTYPQEALDRLVEDDWLPPACRERYVAAAEEVMAIYDEWSEGVPVFPIHGDCHPGNLLLGNEGWFFLDFDDMMIGPAVHDVWMLLPGRDAEAARQRELFVQAYREFRPFDAKSLRLIEPLRAFRFIFYAGWIAKRWADPAFPDAFPHFGTEEYWQNETRDLEEQLERIVSGGDGVGDLAPEAVERHQAKEDDAELTNKDFFWDL